MVYPDICKYIADKSRDGNHNVRLVTNGFFGDDKKQLNFLATKIKPDIISIWYDKNHENLVSTKTIKNIVNKLYGKTEIIFEFFIEETSSEEETKKYILNLEKTFNLEGKKIFYFPILSRGSFLKSNSICRNKLCSGCGIKVFPEGKHVIKCEFGLGPIYDDCKNLDLSVLDYNLINSFLKDKRYYISEKLISEVGLLSHPEKYEKSR